MKSEEILDSFRYYTGATNHARYNEINQAYRQILKRTKWWDTRVSKTDLVEIQDQVDKYKIDFSCFRGSSPTEVYIQEKNGTSWTVIKERQAENLEKDDYLYGYYNSDGQYVRTTQIPPSDNYDNSLYRNYYYCPYYYYLSGDDEYNFTIYPKPNQDLKVRFDGIKAIQDLERGVTPIIGESYHEAIAIMAASIFLDQKQEKTEQDRSRSIALKQNAEEELKSLIQDKHPNRINSVGWRGKSILF